MGLHLLEFLQKVDCVASVTAEDNIATLEGYHFGLELQLLHGLLNIMVCFTIRIKSEPYLLHYIKNVHDVNVLLKGSQFPCLLQRLY